MKSKFYIVASVISACLITAACIIIIFFIPHTAAANSIIGIEESSSSTEKSSSGVIGISSSESNVISGQKVAYLTFDDGPSRLTPKLLEALNSCNVRATFFVVGVNAEVYPDMLKEIVKNNHVIGVHSWTHKYSCIYSSTDNFVNDFNKLKDFITKTTGVTPNICRFPGGTNNTVSQKFNQNHIMRSIVTITENMGFKYYDWNVSSGEASHTPPSTEQIVSTVVSQCKDKDTAVILFHDTDNQGYVDAVPKIVSELSAIGFTFDTLSPNNPPSSKAVAQFKPK